MAESQGREPGPRARGQGYESKGDQGARRPRAEGRTRNKKRLGTENRTNQSESSTAWNRMSLARVECRWNQEQWASYSLGRVKAR